jgi:hypothetical protein
MWPGSHAGVSNDLLQQRFSLEPVEVAIASASAPDLLRDCCNQMLGDVDLASRIHHGVDNDPHGMPPSLNADVNIIRSARGRHPRGNFPYR